MLLPFSLTVCGHRDNPARLAEQPRVVVISYTMLRRLQKSMLEQEWATLIVDESHHLHCSKKSSEKDEVHYMPIMFCVMTFKDIFPCYWGHFLEKKFGL